MKRLGIISAAVVALTVGCGSGLDRDSYVKKNLVLLRAVPPFPGGQLVRLESAPYKDRDTPDAHTIGYGTTRLSRLPLWATPEKVIAFYGRKLRMWHIEDLSLAPSISLRKGNAYLYVMPSPGRLIVEIDHDCYKGGPSPRCFGP